MLKTIIDIFIKIVEFIGWFLFFSSWRNFWWYFWRNCNSFYNFFLCLFWM